MQIATERERERERPGKKPKEKKISDSWIRKFQFRMKASER